MRAAPGAAALASAVSWGCEVSSWLDGVLLAGGVPVLAGRVSAALSRNVPESLELTVPPVTVEAGRSVDWLPGAAGAPLGRFGQTLDVSLVVDGESYRIGRYRIDSWTEGEDGTIRVDGSGMLISAVDDRLLVPTAPRTGGTLRTEFLRLLPGYMTASFDPALVDRPVPSTMEWDENRLDNLYQITDAWPARLRSDAWGQIEVLAPLPDTTVPVLSFRDGPGGTLLAAPTSDTREGIYNVFVARSSADGVVAQAVATVESGPMAPSGPYRPVPKFFSSPLLLNEAQCAAAARTMRDNSVRTSRLRRASIAPDPRPELDDPVELVTGAGTAREAREWGYVVAYDMPLTVADGDGRLDVATF